METSVTINGSPEELYQLWRDPQTLPQVMGHFATVTTGADDHAHWVVNSPAETSLQWDSQIVQETPGGSLAIRKIDFTTASLSQSSIAWLTSSNG